MDGDDKKVDIRHLRYFSKVAKLSSFTKAAAALHVSQPSLSKTIKDLEEELGVSLFHRSSRKLELTDAGTAFLANTKVVLEAFNNLTSQLDDLMDLKKGEIRIGIPPIMGATFFSKLISEYKRKYPMIDITLTEVGSKVIKKMVEDGSLDIGLICNLPFNKESFETIKILKDPLMIIANKESELSSKQSVDLAELRDHPFILYRKDFSLHDSIIEECSKKGFYPIVACESSQSDFMIEMVGAGIGIALLPRKICDQIQDPNIIAIPLENSNIYLELAMIWKYDQHIPFAVREFISTSKHLLPA